MQAPKNRQEFLSMQQQAAAAARDMQRRATLPIPPRQGQEARPGSPGRQRLSGAAGRRQEESRPQFRQPEPLHHKSPSQQARQYASYGRMQPQLRRQEWQTPPNPPHKAYGSAGTPDRRQEKGRSQFQQQPRRRDQTQYQNDPRFREPPPPPPPPPPPAANAMPPLADLLGMLGGLGNLGGLGGLGGAAAQDKQESPESVFGAFEPNEAGGGMDSIMILLLLFLLQKENADQGLLLALMYIMM